MLTFKEFIFEKRSNEDMNPKISTNQRINDYLESAKPLPGFSRTKNAFVSFTYLEKLGINPKSEFSTPLGIYAYSLDYVKKMVGDYDHPGDKLPFAGDHKFINLFSAKGRIINLSSMDQHQYNELYLELQKKYPDETSQKIKDARETAFQKTPGGIFWNLTRLVAEENPVKWNKVFRDLGIDGCVDEGKGIIHPNEPEQAVFFTTSSLFNIQRYDNKYIPSDIESGQKFGEKIRNLRKVVDDINTGKYTDEKAFEILINHVRPDYRILNTINFLPEPIQMQIVQINPFFIEFLKNSSESVQMYVVKKDPLAYKRIKKPYPSVTEYIQKHK